MSPDQLKVYEEIIAGPRATAVGALRAAIHQPALADRWQKFGALLRYDTSLPPALLEIAILATARRWNSQLQWQVHSVFAEQAGIAAEVIEAIKLGAPPAFTTAPEADVYDFVRELQEFGEVSPDLYSRVLGDLDAVGVVELTAIIGYYTMVAMTINAHEIPTSPVGNRPLERINTEGSSALPTLTGLAPARRVQGA
jgi:4-carboxymuconolactone decarboxylase